MDATDDFTVEDQDFLSRDEVLELHARLKRIARLRGALDVEEAKLLRIVDRAESWRLFACVNHLDYMERVLGYLPHTGSERMRVARSLGHLPALEQAMGEGQLCFTAVRELTRVAIASTETVWRDAALGKNLRQIEELVRGREPGDLPSDPPKPEVVDRNVTFSVGPDVFALVRKVRALLADEHGRRLDDSEFLEAVMNTALEAHERPSAEPRVRSKYDIAVTVCRQCDRAKVEGGGQDFDIDADTLDRMRCDARDLGPIDVDEPRRANQAIPPATYRFVWARDGGRCKTPGCRSARGIEAHHLKPRSRGGGNEPQNILLLCSSCHQNIHNGNLILEGPIDDLRANRTALTYKAPWRRERDDLRTFAHPKVPRGTDLARRSSKRRPPLPL